MPKLTDSDYIERTIKSLQAGKSTLDSPYPYRSATDGLVCTGADALRILLAQPRLDPTPNSDGIIFYGHIIDDLTIPAHTIIPHYHLILAGPIDGNVTIDGTIGDHYREPGQDTDIAGLQIEKISGDLTINGTVRNDLIVDTVDGNLTITGNVDNRSLARIRHVGGNIELTRTASVPLSIGESGADTLIDGFHEHISLNNIAGDIHVHGVVRTLGIRGVHGDVNIDAAAKIQQLRIYDAERDITINGQIGVPARVANVVKRVFFFGRCGGTMRFTDTARLDGNLIRRPQTTPADAIHGDLVIEQRSTVTGDIDIPPTAVLGDVVIGDLEEHRSLPGS